MAFIKRMGFINVYGVTLGTNTSRIDSAQTAVENLIYPVHFLPNIIMLPLIVSRNPENGRKAKANVPKQILKI